MDTIRNIYCVGRNYRLHAAELGNAVPSSLMVFSKPTHALAFADGRSIRLPVGQGRVHYEAELVIRIGKPYQKGLSVDELIDAFALGIDFTLRDLQEDLKRKGHPWLQAKGFPNSALVTKFYPFPGVETCADKDFALAKNGVEVQRGNIQDMVFDLQTIVDFCGNHLGLGAGDIIYTGTPAGVGEVHAGDRLQLLWGDDVLGECVIAGTDQ